MDWKSYGKKAKLSCLDFIRQESCIICNHNQEIENQVCSNCRSNLMRSRINAFKPQNRGFRNDRIIWYDQHISLFNWNVSWKKFIYEWKYGNQRNLYKFFFNSLEKKNHLLNCCHIDRMGIIDSGYLANKDRGYRPCADIASFLAKKTGHKYHIDLVKKRRSKQSKNFYEERFWCMHNALKCKTTIRAQNYLLIEDIFTTGATANEASRMLKLAGAKRVIVLSMVSQQEIVSNIVQAA